MKIERKSSFDNISQRILWGFNFVFSDFEPMYSDLSNQDAQWQLHILMGQIIDKLYANPSLIDLPTSEDESYNRYECGNQKPETKKIFLDIFKKIYGFYRFFYFTALMGRISEDTIIIGKESLKLQKAAYKKSFKFLFDEIGINCIVNKEEILLQHHNGRLLFPALQVLADPTENDNFTGNYQMKNKLFEKYAIFNFTRCSFNGNYEYLINRIDDLYQYNGLLINLGNKCILKGYMPYMLLLYGPSTFWYSIKFRINMCDFGFEVKYYPYEQQQFNFGTMSGVGEKAMLENFDNLVPDVQKHFMQICSPCNGKSCCTNGGKTKAFTVVVNYDGYEYKLCPRFPNHDWERFNEEIIDVLFNILKHNKIIFKN